MSCPAGLANSGPWVFVRPGASGVHLPSLRPLWDRVTARAKLPEDVRLYDASRHAFGTAAAELDVDREVRKLLMGHAPGTDAHDRYTHRSRSLVAAADLVSAWLAAALRGDPEPSAKDEEEDRRDIAARRKLVQRARALQDAED